MATDDDDDDGDDGDDGDVTEKSFCEHLQNPRPPAYCPPPLG